MKKLEFSIKIDAAPEKIWKALWEDDNYRRWTAIFMEGSYYVSDLKKGSAIQFLSPGGNGMFGIVEEMIPAEKMYFRHLGEVRNGKPQKEIYGDEATERYDLTAEDGTTRLSVALNTEESFIPYFADVFPKALTILKEIAETDDL